MSKVHQNLIKSYFPAKLYFFMYQPGLAHVLGSINAALLISYLLFYFSDKPFYKTAKVMELDTGLTDNMQRAAIKRCVKLGILQISYARIPCTRHFFINIPVLEKLISSSPKTTELYMKKSSKGSMLNESTINNN
jgi:hypothetical protein